MYSDAEVNKRASSIIRQDGIINTSIIQQ